MSNMDLLKASGYLPNVRRVVDNIGDSRISEITVARKPLSKATTFALNVASLGEFNKRLQETPHDQLFHLFMVITTGHGRFIVEKNDVIHIARFSGFPAGSETIAVPLTGALSVDTMLARTQARMGDKFFTYKGLDNNCQYFVSSLLKANHLSTPKILDFVLQDTRHLFENNPRFRKIVNSITDTGAVSSRIAQGVQKVVHQSAKDTAKDVARAVAPGFSELAQPYFRSLTLQNLAKRAHANPFQRG